MHHFLVSVYIKLRTWWDSYPLRYNHTGRVALCCIGKSENEYIREFVEHYKALGFDRIFIYDNNDPDGEHFEEVIGDYVQTGLCEVIDYRGRKVCQLDAYQECYNLHKDEYDWIAYFDCDEYLDLKTTSNIHEYLGQKKFIPFQQIHVNWMIFGDNNLVMNDGRKLAERFTTPRMPLDFRFRYDVPENSHVKTIIRGGLKNIRWTHTPHDAICEYYRCCDNKGAECDPNAAFCTLDLSEAYLKHYYTKTLEEWVKIKQKRGYPDQTDDNRTISSDLNVFFAINEMTPEKKQYLRENGYAR